MRTRWHNDIKPQNILYVQGQFKLADPGFARFEKQDIESKDATDYMGGTSTFGRFDFFCNVKKELF
jgi:serine/threonine protein kinase